MFNVWLLLQHRPVQVLGLHICKSRRGVVFNGLFQMFDYSRRQQLFVQRVWTMCKLYDQQPEHMAPLQTKQPPAAAAAADDAVLSMVVEPMRATQHAQQCPQCVRLRFACGMKKRAVLTPFRQTSFC